MQVPCFYTIAIRMEMYVSERLWLSLKKSEKCALFSVVRALEDQLSEMLRLWNHQRGGIESFAHYRREQVRDIQIGLLYCMTYQ
jgi:hypothetical protein